MDDRTVALKRLFDEFTPQQQTRVLAPFLKYENPLLQPRSLSARERSTILLKLLSNPLFFQGLGQRIEAIDEEEQTG